MGCDIHMFVEKYIDGRWEIVPNAFISHDDAVDFEGPDERSYLLFGRLAGVRSRGGPALFPDRGMPADVDPDWPRVDVWWADGAPDIHHISWATFGELLSADWDGLAHCAFVEWLYGEDVACLIKMAYGAQNLRLVFGFDN